MLSIPFQKFPFIGLLIVSLANIRVLRRRASCSCKKQVYQTWHLFDVNPVRTNICPSSTNLEVMCSYIPTRIIRFQYVYQVTTRHQLSLDIAISITWVSPLQRRCWNRRECMYRKWQEFNSPTRPNKRYVFSRPGHMQKYVASFDVANNNRHAPRALSKVKNEQFKYGGDPKCRSRDICPRAVAGKSRCRGRSPEDDDSLTFDLYGFDMCELDSMVFELFDLEILSYIRIHTHTRTRARAHTHTHTHTKTDSFPFKYIHNRKLIRLQCICTSHCQPSHIVIIV